MSPRRVPGRTRYSSMKRRVATCSLPPNGGMVSSGGLDVQRAVLARRFHSSRHLETTSPRDEVTREGFLWHHTATSKCGGQAAVMHLAEHATRPCHCVDCASRPPLDSLLR